MLSQHQLAALVRDFYDDFLQRENTGRLRLGVISEERRAMRAAYFKNLAKRARADLGANDFNSVDTIGRLVIQKHGLTDKIDEFGRKQVLQALLRGRIEIGEAVGARYEGDFNFAPVDELLTRRADAASPVAIDSVPPFHQPVNEEPFLTAETPKPERHELFSQVAATFVAKQKQLRRWENQTAAQNEKSYELFKAICDDRPLRSYARKDAARFKDVLERLPADYGKAARYLGKGPLEILALDAESGSREERLSIRTVKRHFSALSGLWDEAIPAGDATEKIFSGFKFPQQQRAQDQRPMWTRADLARLFKTPIWSGCKSEGRRSSPGDLIIRDEKFWLPLIAIFSGARQEELCQLHVDDVREEEGVWVFDINARGARRLKNASAVRLVPIHDELIRMGLLAYVDRQRGAGHERIFPNLHPGGADGRLGHAFTKWFTRYRRDVEVYEEGKDFHSFRHSATTFLHQGGAGDSLIDRLTGHTTPGETARYTKRSDIGQLRAAIQAVDVGIDFSGLYEG